MSFLDPGGEIVRAVNDEAKKAILNSVEKKYRKHISFNENGFVSIDIKTAPIDKISLDGIRTDISPNNITSLAMLVNSDEMISVNVIKTKDIKVAYKDSDGQRQDKTREELGYIDGITLFNSDDIAISSPNEWTQVILWNFEDENFKGKIVAHELYGHVFYYLFGNGLPFIHDNSNVQSELDKRCEEVENNSTE